MRGTHLLLASLDLVPVLAARVVSAGYQRISVPLSKGLSVGVGVGLGRSRRGANHTQKCGGELEQQHGCEPDAPCESVSGVL